MKSFFSFSFSCVGWNDKFEIYRKFGNNEPLWKQSFIKINFTHFSKVFVQVYL